MSVLVAVLALQAMPVPEDGPRRARSTQSLASWVSDSDYPADALASGAEGTVAFRLVVDPEGRVADCKIEQSSGHASLDARTCVVMTERARFHPARNAAGQFVIDTVRSRIRWVMGETLPPGMTPFAPLRMAFILSMTGDRQFSCSIEVNGVAAPEGTSCPEMSPALTQAAGSIAPPGRLVLLRSFIPAGESASVATIPYGQLLAENAVEITIDAEGTVTTCRTVLRELHVPGSPTPPEDLCRAPRWPRFTAGTPDRRARITAELYRGAGTPP